MTELNAKILMTGECL